MSELRDERNRQMHDRHSGSRMTKLRSLSAATFVLPSARYVRRPWMEVLEDRCLLAASPSVLLNALDHSRTDGNKGPIGGIIQRLGFDLAELYAGYATAPPATAVISTDVCL